MRSISALMGKGGASPRLAHTDTERRALVEIVESGSIPAIHGIDRCQLYPSGLVFDPGLIVRAWSGALGLFCPALRMNS
jgi:hypothetical protein